MWVLKNISFTIIDYNLKIPSYVINGIIVIIILKRKF